MITARVRPDRSLVFSDPSDSFDSKSNAYRLLNISCE